MVIEAVTDLSDSEPPQQVANAASAASGHPPGGLEVVEPPKKDRRVKSKPEPKPKATASTAAKSRAKGKAGKIEAESEEKPKAKPKAKSKSAPSMKRPAAQSQKTAPVKDDAAAAEDHDDGSVPPVAKKPAGIWSCCKSLYKRDGVWGLKVQKREVFRVGFS